MSRFQNILLPIVSGGRHTIAISETNKIYVWGANQQGQLGLGDIYHRIIPTELTIFHNSKLMQRDIKSIICGYAYTFLLMKNGSCYVWGDNSDGQLGLGNLYSYIIFYKKPIGDKTNRLKPTLLSIPNEKMLTIYSGSEHSFTITNKGNYYVWGCNDEGQLGLGDQINRLAPTKFIPPKTSTSYQTIKMGHNHGSIISEDGECYVWGNNEYNQITVCKDFVTFPQQIKFNHEPVDEKIVQVDFGSNFIIIVSSFGKVYSKGGNRSGTLGIDEHYHSAITQPINITEKIIDISCGYNHTIALSENTAYVWGDNTYGQLGTFIYKTVKHDIRKK